jgi:hypothetical protein
MPRKPLSAQAQTPIRPSGADKEKEAANKEGGQRRSGNRAGTGGCGRCLVNSIGFAANQHCQTRFGAKILTQNR